MIRFFRVGRSSTTDKPTFYKIVQRFYQTPEGLSSGSNKRKAKIPIPAAPKTGFPPHIIGGQVRFTPTSSGEFKFKVSSYSSLFYFRYSIKEERDES